MNQRGIGVSNLPNVKYRSFCKAGIDFNIMTVGSNGLGKSSFINQMLGTCVLSPDPFLEAKDGFHNYEVLEVSGKDTVATAEDKYYHRNAVLNIQISKFFVMENDFQTRITVTEIDGVGDNVCNQGCWEPVVDLLNENFKDFLNQERKNVRSMIKDKRIHVCVYFLEPNPAYIKTADVRTMKEISRICNLIPVVGKSDLLNDTEKQECYNRIIDVLSEENIDAFPLDLSLKERTEMINGPFFVISKNMENGGEKALERKYPWGSLFLERVKNNDFYVLTDSLITKNLINLIEATENFYDNYRTKEIGRSIGKTGSLRQDDKKLTREIQNKIKEDEETIAELRQRMLEKKRKYESRLFEMANKCIDEN